MLIQGENQVRQMDRRQSEQFIVPMKGVKASGGKGLPEGRSFQGNKDMHWRYGDFVNRTGKNNGTIPNEAKT